MKISKSGMTWNNITQKLKVGVALADRANTLNGRLFNNAIEKIAYKGAKATGQLEGFGDTDLISKLQSGELIPDDLFGWNTKTVLTLLLLLMLFKLKKLQGR